MNQLRLVVSEEEIKGLVRRLGAEINRFYSARKEDSPVLVLGILNGAFIFLADLVRTLSFPLEIDFIRAASYGSSFVSSGSVQILFEPSYSLEGRDLLLVDELIDTGRSLEVLVRHCKTRGARSVVSAVLLDKYQRREVAYKPDFVGRAVENVFLAGYGLDGGGLHRQYPAIYAIDPDN